MTRGSPDLRKTAVATGEGLSIPEVISALPLRTVTEDAEPKPEVISPSAARTVPVLFGSTPAGMVDPSSRLVDTWMSLPLSISLN